MADEKETAEAHHLDLVPCTSEDDVTGGFTEAEQKAIIRRVDRRLVATVGAMYCASLMDRTNMGATIIAGMGQELKLIDNRYNVANLVFFITYIIFQPPSTVLIRAIGPRLHLSIIALLWGSVTLSMGFVKDHIALTGLRALLGVLEAGFFPSCVYLLSTWYTRYEVGKRYSVFYIIGSVASAFAGILSYGLMQLNGKGGLSGWRWIFLVQGLITIVISIASYWLLVDFPDSRRKTWSFLGRKERQWIVDRIHRDRGDTAMPPFNLRKFLSGGLDWKIWAYAFIFFNSTTMAYALAYTLPLLLVSSMGFSVGAAQCLVAPPYAFAGIIMYATGYVGDKYRVRGPIIIFNMFLCIIGLPLMGWHPNPNVRYFGVFLVTAGANSNVPAVMSFQANNVRGQWKRAFCSATLVGFGAIGGIAGSLVFREQDKLTGYKPGMWACLACVLLTIILVIVCDTAFYFENKKADRGEKRIEVNEDEGTADFRYTY